MDEHSPKCCRLPPNLLAASRETSKSERRVLNGTLEHGDSALRQYQRVQSNAWLRRATCYRANLPRAQPLSLSTCSARVGLSLVSGSLLVRTVKHLRQPSSHPRTLETDGADRNVLRSGSSAGSESASLRIVTRLSSRWWLADSLLSIAR